ncbi:unnamed protein product [[Candida] boidinii]|uniref:Unnamed protein product n=1 Tax=Candida boidinii TaxID=5477 RepID=A0A9W6T111_CANBO|nr:unnamed protein product [[Candida] boidinii]GMG17539.1 unnamed protein product [[Candida] boidinii]
MCQRTITGLNHLITVGGSQQYGDIYLETVPENELKFYQKRGTKRKKLIPQYYSLNDRRILKSVRDWSYWLDLSFSLCGVRLGWGGIIGLIPGIGDVICLALSLWLIRKATGIDGGLHNSIKVEMTTNTLIDFGIGLIPFVGDFINIAYKANTRNYQLLENALLNHYPNHVFSETEVLVDSNHNTKMINKDSITLDSI